MMILVADFESDSKLGPFRMTRIIFEQLQTALKPYSDTKVELLGRRIDWKKGINEGLTTCDKRRGSMVIWGDYDNTRQAVAVSIHFDLLAHRDRNVAPWSESREATYELGDLEHFTIQDRVAKQLTYASLFATALTRFRVGDYDSAITMFTEALNQSEGSNQNPAFFWRARALAKVARYKDAMDDFTRIIENDETYAYALNNRGACRIEIGDAIGGVLDLTRAIAIAPTDALAYNNRGSAFYALGKYRESLADYESAIRYSSRDPLPYVGRGNANDRLGKFDQAMADYEYALRIDARQATAYFNRGVAFFRHGDTGPAIQDFTRAIQLKAGFVDAYRARAICYVRENKRDEAVRDYRSAITAARSSEVTERLETELKGVQANIAQ
jgi:tetratricopeptide (TPR) repeat protein